MFELGAERVEHCAALRRAARVAPLGAAVPLPAAHTHPINPKHHTLSSSPGILSAQLLLTALIAAPIVLHGPTRAFVAASPGVVLLSALGAFAIVMVLSFSEEARHRHPTNLILLAAFTALEGVAVGATAAAYTLPSVALAVAVTAGATGALAAYAQRAKTDYTARGGALVSALSALLLTSVFALFVRSRAVEVVLAGFGAALFSAYLVWDVQLLLGGQHARFQLRCVYIAVCVRVFVCCASVFVPSCCVCCALHVVCIVFLSLCAGKYPATAAHQSSQLTHKQTNETNNPRSHHHKHTAPTTTSPARSRSTWTSSTSSCTSCGCSAASATARGRKAAARSRRQQWIEHRTFWFGGAAAQFLVLVSTRAQRRLAGWLGRRPSAPPFLAFQMPLSRRPRRRRPRRRLFCTV